MKIIHSYFPNTEKKNNVESYLLLSKLSVESILKFYDNVELYTTEKNKEIVEKYGIPYTNIDTKLFDGVDKIKNYALSKIMVYNEQNEPYIHIDYDVVLNQKIDFEEQICFGHMDYYDNQFFKFKEEYYLKNYRLIKDLLPDDVKVNVDVNFIPNFCIFGAKDYNSVKTTFNKILRFYYNNLNLIDGLNYAPSLIEQFLFLPFYKTSNDLKSENIKIISTHPMLSQYVDWYNIMDIYMPFIHFTDVKNNEDKFKTILKINY